MNDQTVYKVKSAKLLRKVSVGAAAGIIAVVVSVAALFGIDLPPEVLENIEFLVAGVGALVWLVQFAANYFTEHGDDDFEIVPRRKS